MYGTHIGNEYQTFILCWRERRLLYVLGRRGRQLLAGFLALYTAYTIMKRRSSSLGRTGAGSYTQRNSRFVKSCTIRSISFVRRRCRRLGVSLLECKTKGPEQDIIFCLNLGSL